MSVIIKDELAKIAIAKNLIKEYKNSNSERTVYLNDGTEFQIYLKNPFQYYLGIRISVNNQSIGNMLVLRPGQSFWLDRFLNDNKKFLFSTYKVENTPEMKYAISNNGVVKIEFYRENEQVYNPNITWTNTTLPYYTSYTSDNSCGSYNVNSLSGLSGSSVNTCYCNTVVDASASTSITNNNDVILSLQNFDIDFEKTPKAKKNPSLETGRVEKGGISRQEFDYCDIEFRNYPFKTETIHILPSSQKQVRVEDTRRRYCSQCGKKVHPKDKFCSGCGARLN